VDNSEMAFPCPMSEQTYSNQDCAPYSKGLTKREWFAGQALKGMLSAEEYVVGYKFDDNSTVAQRLAKDAYIMADEMLKVGQS